MVTGAGGFIGTQLVRAIRGLGGEAIEVDRDPDLHTLVERHQPQYVYHLAASVVSREDPSLILPMLDNDLRFAVCLLNALCGSSCLRVIQAGTSLETNDPRAPASPYALTKACARLYATYYTRHAGLPVVHARLDMIYGPGQPEHRLIPYLIRTLSGGETPELRTPDHRFGCVYIDDAVRALIECAVADGLAGSTVDIAAAGRVSVRELAILVEDALLGAQPRIPAALARPEPEPSTHGWNWRPEVSLFEGIRMTVAGRKRAKESVA